MQKIIFVSAFVLLLVGALSVYRDLTTLTITELNHNSTEYDGREVTIKGVVSKNAGVLGAGAYIVSDDNSDILILSKSGIPEFGSKISVSGMFKKAVSFNSFEYNVIYQE